MKDPLKTAQRLLTLALGPATPETEARNAAMAACRVIQEHGLLARMPPALEGMFGDWFAQGGFRAPRPAPAPPPPVEPDAVPPPRRRPRVEVINLPSNVEAVCVLCHRVMTLTAMYVDGKLWHVTCYDTMKDTL